MTDDKSFSTWPVRWSQSVCLLNAGLIVGPVGVEDHPVDHEFGRDRAQLKELLASLARMNGALKMADKSECVLFPDLLDNLPNDARSRRAFFDSISNAPHISCLLLTHDPERLASIFPSNWDGRAFTNLCIAVILDGNERKNRQRLEALRKVPAKYRGIWMSATSPTFLPEGWEQGIHWLVADSACLPEDCVKTIYSACRKSEIPCLFILGGESERCAAHADTVGIPHHPFKAKFNLYENSAYGRLMHPKPSSVSKRATAMEEGIEATLVTETALPMTDSNPCPSGESSAAHDEEVLPAVLSATAVTASSADVAHSHIDAVVMKSEDETPGERFVRRDQEVRAGLRACIDAGVAFLEIRDDELWREGGYKCWNDYCVTIQETTRSYINRLINHAIISRELSDRKPPSDLSGRPILPTAESQSRPLKKLPDCIERAKAWALAVKYADGLPTAKIVTGVVNGILRDVAPAKVRPSRGDRRLELLHNLRHEVLSRGPSEGILALITLLIELESPTTHTK